MHRHNSANKPAIGLIGCGPHGQRFYLKAVKRWAEHYGVKLACIVELPEVVPKVQKLVSTLGLSAEGVAVDPFDGPVPAKIAATLDELVRRHKLQGVGPIGYFWRKEHVGNIASRHCEIAEGAAR